MTFVPRIIRIRDPTRSAGAMNTVFGMDLLFDAANCDLVTCRAVLKSLMIIF